jgi:hypothetical protein
MMPYLQEVTQETYDKRDNPADFVIDLVSCAAKEAHTNERLTALTDAWSENQSARTGPILHGVGSEHPPVNVLRSNVELCQDASGLTCWRQFTVS